MNSFVRFFKYNNALPIAVSFLILGASSTLAYNNPEVIYEREDQVISIDNTYISEVDFDRYSPTIRILSVTEDDENYYIEYEFSTIALKNAVWQDVTTLETLTVPKQRLGEYRDLGLYVTEELNEKIRNEEKRLIETQAIERQQKSTKKVATKYRGIVGGMLSEEVASIEKYRPRVKPPKPEQKVENFARPPANPPQKEEPEPEPELAEAPVEPAPAEEPDDAEAATGAVAGQATTTDEKNNEDESEETDDTASPSPDSSDGSNSSSENDAAKDASDQEAGDSSGDNSENEDDTNDTNDTNDTSSSTEADNLNQAPQLSILGDDPAQVKVGNTYTDLGATVTDDRDTDLSVNVYLNGEPVEKVTIDTATATTHSIVYEAVDNDGASSQTERIVEVFEPLANDPGTESDSEGAAEEVSDDQATSSDESDAEAGSEQTSSAADEQTDNEPESVETNQKSEADQQSETAATESTPEEQSTDRSDTTTRSDPDQDQESASRSKEDTVEQVDSSEESTTEDGTESTSS